VTASDTVLDVRDVYRCIELARSAGSMIVEEPQEITGEHGMIRWGAIADCGDSRHTLVDRSRYDGVYLPGYVARTSGFSRRKGAPGRIFQRCSTTR
jgi:4-hydroxyphenylpyruvate dioxygenase